MRARIHLTGGRDVDDAEPTPLHFDPEKFLESTVPSYPEVDETRPDPYGLETHHESHTEAVTEWRRSVRSHLRDTIELPVEGVDHEVDVKYLG